MQSDCEICYCNAAPRRRGEPLWEMKVGEGTWRGPRNPYKPSKNVDKQIPEMKSFPSTRLDLSLIVLFTVTAKDASLFNGTEIIGSRGTIGTVLSASPPPLSIFTLG